MVIGAGKVSLQCDSSPMFGTVEKVSQDSSKSVTTITADTNSQSPIYIRYKDHVIFKNISEPSAVAVVRETIGWVKEQNEELLLIEHDRAIPSRGKNVNGLIILKNCIMEAHPLLLQNNLKWVLNSAMPTVKMSMRSGHRSEKLKEQKSSKGEN